MEHIFHVDNEGREPKKFVTAQREDGTPVTLINAPTKNETPHDILMAKLLAMEGIAEIPEDAVVAGLRQHARACLGGGRFEQGGEWTSSTLINALKRNQPNDPEQARKILGEIREWFERTMAVGTR
jgi:hypothetical protein